MNKDLMMRAAVQFKGVWPDEEETHLYEFHNGRFVTGMAGGTAGVVCTREQFEDFVESLFEGAPDDATHVDCENTKRYYRYDGREYHLISELNPVRCANFDKLIPRPSKKAEPQAPYMPKVGDRCSILEDYILCGNTPLKIKKGDTVIVKAIVDLGYGEIALITDESILGSGTIIFSQLQKIKTERQLFIERATKDYLDQVGSDAVNSKWFGRIFGALYDKDYTKGGAK